jgi:hypothetical protein
METIGADVVLSVVPGGQAFIPIVNATSAAIQTAGAGGHFNDILKAGAVSYGSSYVFNSISNWKPSGFFPNAGKIIGSGTVGAVAAGIQGGSFGEGFLMGAGSAAANMIYTELVKYEPTFAPGGEIVEKGFNTPPVNDANNIGLQGIKDPNWLEKIFVEGGPVSRGVNYVPGINAVAGLHDVFQINMGGLARNIFNVPGMGVAAVITGGALMYGPLTAQYITMASSDD